MRSDGVLGRDLLPCVAEPGDVGRQELVPPDGIDIGQGP